MIAANGRWLGRIPAARARALLRRGAKVEETRRNKVFAIRLREAPAPAKPPSVLTPASYAGQRYVYREAVKAGGEQVARCYSLRKIDREDRGVFVSVLADVCTVAK